MASDLQYPLFEDASSASSDQTTESAQKAQHSKGSIPNADDAISLLALSEIQGVGFATVRALVELLHARLSLIWEMPPETLLAYLQHARSPAPAAVVVEIEKRGRALLSMARDRYRFLEARRTFVLLRGAEQYPRSLYDLPSAPAWLFVEGNFNLLSDPNIAAVVGTRQPTLEGLQAAKLLSIELAMAGSVILSGLAEGIDAVGHRTALDYGALAIAVVGHGIDVVYPAATADLRRQIIESGGAIVSEYLPRDSYNRERFVQRNRIQAALSKAVVAIEGQAKSGTAHTVRFAQALKRTLFGVRMGYANYTPQQEILLELVRLNAPIYDLAEEADIANLRVYLNGLFPKEELTKQRTAPRAFRGVLREINRITAEYPVTERDFEWLMQYIDRVYERHRQRNAPDAD